MGTPSVRRMVGCVLLLMVPASLFGADSGAAMLYANGPIWLNGSHVPNSSAIFAGDLVQTRSDAAANIHASGSSITVLGDSLVQFEGDLLKVQHGGVSVSTSKAVATVAGDVTISPSSNAWTEFNVIDTGGMVRIAARKGDLVVSDQSGSVTLPQGQETTRNETSDQPAKKKGKGHGDGAPPAAGGGILSSPVAIGIAGAAAGAVTAWVLVKNSTPLSPANPNN